MLSSAKKHIHEYWSKNLRELNVSFRAIENNWNGLSKEMAKIFFPCWKQLVCRKQKNFMGKACLWD